MPLILLIRHGENEYVKTGRLAGRLPSVHLNEKGQSQAQAVADSLAAVPLSAIYSSPLERAQQTAAPLGARLGQTVQHCEGLLEVNIGEWAGQELSELRKLEVWKTVQNSPSRFRFPGGESFHECQVRAVTAIEQLATTCSNPGDIIALFSHADPIKLILAHYLGMPLDHFQRLGCDTASLSALVLTDHGVMLPFINQPLPYTLSLPEKPKPDS